MCDPLTALLTIVSIGQARKESHKQETRIEKHQAEAKAAADERERKRKLALFDPAARPSETAGHTSAANRGRSSGAGFDALRIPEAT